VYFSNSYVLNFGIVVFILDDNSCMPPFEVLPAAIECSLLLYNTAQDEWSASIIMFNHWNLAQ